jgi:hypothetical protein
MDAKAFSMVAGVIFAVVALLHLVRILMEWHVTIGDWSVPKSVSWVALIVVGGLALLGLRLGQREERASTGTVPWRLMFIKIANGGRNRGRKGRRVSVPRTTVS